jgi:F-type H+-transporting ATPase subunit delta
MAAFVSRYAQAFLDVVTSRKLDTAALDRQWSDFLGTWDGSLELREFFVNPAIANEQKIAFLDKMNGELGLGKELRNLIAVMIHNDRIGEVHEVAKAYRRALQDRLGIRQVQIVTARELTKQEKGSLEAEVAKLAQSRIEADFELDESILGGTIVRIGSTVYDGSVRGRLERLKEQLAADSGQLTADSKQSAGPGNRGGS